MDLGLDGRVALVVGGNGYLGRAITGRLRDEGAIAVSASRRGDDGGIRMDAGDDAAVASAVQEVLAEHGRLDALVVTAAPSAGTLDPATSADPDAVLAAIDAKAMTFLRVANAVLPSMRGAGYGRIVGISGQNAVLTGNLRASVRNAALTLSAQSLADAAAGSGVTVNVVNPGPVADEPATEVAAARPGESSPRQIADLVAFLASPLAGAISGESIAIGHRVRGIARL